VRIYFPAGGRFLLPASLTELSGARERRAEVKRDGDFKLENEHENYPETLFHIRNFLAAYNRACRQRASAKRRHCR
jgi:hypothetical protein